MNRPRSKLGLDLSTWMAIVFVNVTVFLVGFLTVTDDRGRILGQKLSDSAGFASLLVDVPLGQDRTLFDRYGTRVPDAAGFISLGLLCS